MAVARPRIPLPDAAGLFQKMPAEAEYMATLTARLSQEINARAPDDSARASLLLQSPGGSVYAIFVDDAGAVTTAKVSGGG